ncbi:hypothetical protein ABPG72_003277 [Tetrahymena utriculariae]
MCGSPNNFSAIVKNNKISSQVNSNLLYWHSQKFNMQTQTNYLKQYILDLPEGNNTCILGHSVGAKIVMATLCQHKQELHDKVKGVVIVDMLPFNTEQASQQSSGVGSMKQFLEKLLHLDLQSSSLEEIMKKINEIVPNKRIADLLSQNIDMESKKWKINVEEIVEHYQDFIHHKIEGTWPGKVLVIAGENSNYVSRSQIHTFKEVFENINLEKDVKFIEKAGHWVQADQPIIFINEVSHFLKKIFH